MRYAVVSGGVGDTLTNAAVEDIIVMDPELVDEMEAALGKRLLEATPLGLIAGDLFNGTHWTRNVDGEQVVLPIEQDSTDVEEALAILLGEVE